MKVPGSIGWIVQVFCLLSRPPGVLLLAHFVCGGWFGNVGLLVMLVCACLVGRCPFWCDRLGLLVCLCLSCVCVCVCLAAWVLLVWVCLFDCAGLAALVCLWMSESPGFGLVVLLCLIVVRCICFSALTLVFEFPCFGLLAIVCFCWRACWSVCLIVCFSFCFSFVCWRVFGCLRVARVGVLVWLCV